MCNCQGQTVKSSEPYLNHALPHGLRSIRWRIQTSLGKLYQSQARRKQAEAAFATARAIVEELAAAIPDQALREGYLSSARAMWLRPPAPTPRRVAKNAFEGLTTREREIAALIAQGRINREIAEALVVGERTVETHISNILSASSILPRAARSPPGRSRRVWPSASNDHAA